MAAVGIGLEGQSLQLEALRPPFWVQNTTIEKAWVPADSADEGIAEFMLERVGWD